jgi:hypothetical protein
VEYLRWLQQQSRLFLKLTYTEDDKAQLPNSDNDNEVVDEYDESTQGRHRTTRAWTVPKLCDKYFSVHVVSTIFLIEVLIYDYCLQALQLGRFANETGNVLSHPLNSAASHNVLHAFAEVSMISIFF